MSKIRDLAERLWTGTLTSGEAHPVTEQYREGDEIVDGVLFYKGFASANTIDTGDGARDARHGRRSPTRSRCSRRCARGGRTRRCAAAVFSHHHVDHIFGVRPFEEEAQAKGWPRPLVYGHEGLRAELRPLQEDARLEHRDQRAPVRASRSSASSGRRSTATPTSTYDDRMTFRSGDLTFELHHGARRDRRRDVDVDPGDEDPRAGRPLHLGGAERGQSAEGAALLRRVGGGAARDGRARRGDDDPRPRPADLRRGPRRAGAHRHGRAARVARGADARADEHRARRSTACCTR